MSPRITGATALRVLQQIRHDPRTIALLLVVPAVLLLLLYWVFEGEKQVFQEIGAPLCGLLPFIVMFLITSIAMLRERTTGTLERLMTLPLSKLDILAGYGAAFGLLATVQAIVVVVLGFGILDLHAAHGAWLVALLAIGNALLGMALGLFVSAFAQTEFQAVQFMPALIMPQLILCGLFVPRDQMAPILEAISWALPLTYAFEALAKVTSHKPLGAGFAADVLVIVGVTIAALGLGALTLRRRTG
jgi:ABC transporter DrrB family efflux protein